MRAACDVGGDVDTVAAVAGGLAGSLYGLSGIPERWLERLNGVVLGERYDVARLVSLAKAVLSFKSRTLPLSIGWRSDEIGVRYGFDEYHRS